MIFFLGALLVWFFLPNRFYGRCRRGSQTTLCPRTQDFRAPRPFPFSLFCIPLPWASPFHPPPQSCEVFLRGILVLRFFFLPPRPLSSWDLLLLVPSSFFSFSFFFSPHPRLGVLFSFLDVYHVLWVQFLRPSSTRGWAPCVSFFFFAPPSITPGNGTRGPL